LGSDLIAFGSNAVLRLGFQFSLRLGKTPIGARGGHLIIVLMVVFDVRYELRD